MELKPNVDVVYELDQSSFEEFVEQARATQDQARWRCFFCQPDLELYTDTIKKNITIEFLRNSLSSAHDVRVFWLQSGHLYVFFQGSVRAALSGFEKFLDSLSEEQERLDYCFWEFDTAIVHFEEVIPLQDTHTSGNQLFVSRKQPKDDALEKLKRQRRERAYPLLMIVEDDRITQRFLEAMMKKYCDVVVVSCAQRALEMYNDILPNIVFLDIELPDGDGLELVEKFHKNDQESFVVMVSGSISSDKIQKCLAEGAKGFVAKPVEESRLLHFVNEYNSTKSALSA